MKTPYCKKCEAYFNKIPRNTDGSCPECGEVPATLKIQSEPVADVPCNMGGIPAIVEAAQSLFDNRLGWSEGRQPYAPRDFWADLGAALYGEDDPRVQELREEARP